MAAGGYPDDYAKGDVIVGLDAEPTEGCKVFHAGTSERAGQIVTNGGRVLCATALGATVAEAQVRAYGQVGQIQWRNLYYRRDIGYRAVARELAGSEPRVDGQT